MSNVSLTTQSFMRFVAILIAALALSATTFVAAPAFSSAASDPIMSP